MGANIFTHKGGGTNIFVEEGGGGYDVDGHREEEDANKANIVVSKQASSLQGPEILVIYIFLRPGFTQQESLQLFSSYLHVPQEYLPAEAKAIHDECKVWFVTV